jgi:ATP-binding cassette subfamily B protein
VQLWNRPLLENLLYGADDASALPQVLEAAGLVSIVAKLPDGLATPLGEGGALLSAGEAQCVRLARAMLKRNPKLVILDEPFLGLERDRRRALLTNVRQHWSESTVLYVTHDVAETRSFGRVIVIEHGTIVEDGDPKVLAQSSSRYRWLLQAQERVHGQLSGPQWKHLRLEGGQLVQEHVKAIEQTA